MPTELATAALAPPAARLEAALAALCPLEKTAYCAELAARLEECRRIARAKLAEDAAAARERLPLAIVAGGTNVGKTTIANAIAGEDLGRPAPVARSTKAAVLYVPREAAAAFCRASFLPGYERRHARSPGDASLDDLAGTLLFVEHAPRGEGDPLDRIALADTPDIDSVLSGNRRVALDLLYAADAVVFVASEEKYNDEACVGFLARAARYGKAIVAVLNKSAAPEAEADFRENVLPRALAGEKPAAFVTLPCGPLEGEPARALRAAVKALAAHGPALIERARRGAARALCEEARPAIALLRREAETIEHYRAEVRAVAQAAAARYRAALASLEIVEFDRVFRLLAEALRLPVIDDLYLRLRAAGEPFVGYFRRALGLADPVDLARRRLEARDRRERDCARVELAEALAEVRRLPERYPADLAEALRAAAAPAPEAERLHALEADYLETLSREAQRWTETVLLDLHAKLRARRGTVALIKALKAIFRTAAAAAAIAATGGFGLEDLVIAPAIDLLVRSGVEAGIDRAYFAARRDEFHGARASVFARLVRERAEALALARLSGAKEASVAEFEAAVEATMHAAGGGPR